MPAGALAAAKPQQDGRRTHRRIRQLRSIRNACMDGAFVPIWSQLNVLSRGLVAVVSGIANKADRNAVLNPLGQSMLHESLGAIPGSEATTGEGIFNSDVFAHG